MLVAEHPLACYTCEKQNILLFATLEVKHSIKMASTSELSVFLWQEKDMPGDMLIRSQCKECTCRIWHGRDPNQLKMPICECVFVVVSMLEMD